MLKIDSEHRHDPFQCPVSFCIPIAERPVVGWTPGKISLIVLVIGFALMGVGAWLATTAESETGDANPVLLTIACLCSLTGFGMLFVPVKGARMILCRLIGDRIRDKLAHFGNDQTLSSELASPGIEGKKLSIDGDDHVLTLFDDEKRRVLIEGIGTRYQLRGDDVTHLAPYPFMSYVGVELTCRIDSHTSLRIALARVSLLTEMINQLPPLFFLRKRIKNPLLDRCRRTLQPDGTESEDVDYEDVETVD